MDYKLNYGVHRFKFRTVNDGGGFTVVGISEKIESSYESTVGVAGDGFSSSIGVFGNWDKKLSWTTNQEITMEFDYVQGYFRVITPNDSAKYTF